MTTTDVRDMTAAQVGLDTERQIQIALQEIVDRGGEAKSDQLYEAIERNMPADIVLSQQGRDTFCELLNREAVRQGYIKPPAPNRPGWRITASGRDYIGKAQEEIGVEKEETLPDEPSDIAITKPFNPAAIKVGQRTMTVFQVMRKIDLAEIELNPEFQRKFVWNLTRQSRLIESILLRIPLPAFYLDATDEGRWLVVDGLQRLTTMHLFYKGKLQLTNLEYLKELEGKTFAGLPRNLQRQIEDQTEFNLYIIEPETPSVVKFMIFSRVNTGGLVLTQQEIRHALSQGRATTYLAELAEIPEFLRATSNSISPLRMDDRECVLRFLAFHINPYTTFRSQDFQSFDSFLSEMMERLNKTPEPKLAELRKRFCDAMIKAERVFEQYAFRKMYQRQGRRTQISKPLFEAWSVLLQPRPLELLEKRREHIIDGFIKQMNQNIAFNKAISYGTGSPTAVSTRFQTIEKLLDEALA
jgi:hypothetical protein